MPLRFSYSTVSSFGTDGCCVSTVIATAGEAMALSPLRVSAVARPCSDERAEPGDRLADDQVLHLIRAFVGVERLGVGEEARDVVVGENAVAAQQLARPGDRLTPLGR